MICSSCGKEVTNSNFCPFCGQSMGANFVAYNEVTSPPPAPSAVKKGSNTKIFIILSCIMAFVIVVLIGVCGYIMWSDSDEESTERASTSDTDITSAEEETAQEECAPFPRLSTYDSSYTYKRMTDIHNSYQSDDATTYKLEKAVADFNDAWIEYVNHGDDDVFDYLKSGTQAHTYAVSYGKMDIKEEYVLMDVNDVRQYGDTYFVWTHEIIKRTSTTDTTKNENKEYFWVYRISHSGGGYYIEDYISDPAYAK